MEDMGIKLKGHYKVAKKDTKPAHFKRDKYPRWQKCSKHTYNCYIVDVFMLQHSL